MGYLMVQGWNERGRVQVLTIGLFLAISFLVSLAGLTALIWAVSTDQFSFGQKQARIIFIEGEEGTSTIQPQAVARAIWSAPASIAQPPGR
jgi:nitrogen fixation-related uncharacterized protein